ncbi:allene oxide cyclase barrel-like domain-containing protein [Streptomyces monomycini]|uniref:allene oxide cyclase barrel-like domain-containing protein n=1 Tax=Streptomyces monomycini TaxID=371720 RepID=UPI00067E54E3|nr:hypothetical protein [Streptomyces monomycini]
MPLIDPFTAAVSMCSACAASMDTEPATVTEEPSDDCFTLTGLSETVDLDYRAVEESGFHAGDRSTHTDEFFDADGASVGHLLGHSWKVLKQADGRLMAFYREEIDLPDGQIQTAGWIDVNAILAGEWQALHAVGTGGRFLGKVGVRELRSEVLRKRFRANLVLCGAVSR